MDREMLQYLTHAACNRIDKIIDAMPKPATEADFAEVNDCIQHVRNHLESRAAQTAVPFVPPSSAMLLDAFISAENSIAISATDAELNALLGL